MGNAPVDENALSLMQLKGVRVNKDGDAALCDPGDFQLIMPVPGKGILLILIAVQITGAWKSRLSVPDIFFSHLIQEAGRLFFRDRFIRVFFLLIFHLLCFPPGYPGQRNILS